jgi:hypothetical protein
MPQVGFEPTTPVFELPKTVHAVDRPGHCDGHVTAIRISDLTKTRDLFPVEL